jgi:hypothetical protein
VSVVVTVVPLRLAEIVGVTDDDSPGVVTVNVPVVAPAATMTVDGTDASEVLDDSETIEPPVGAARLSVTVPVTELPPTTVPGFTVTV